MRSALFGDTFPHMADNLQRYLPEFDDENMRERLRGRSQQELVEMLIRAYKEKRVLAKLLDEEARRKERIRTILDEPTELLKMPDVPGEDDLRRMMEE
jgi:hypothetical protein